MIRNIKGLIWNYSYSWTQNNNKILIKMISKNIIAYSNLKIILKLTEINKR